MFTLSNRLQLELACRLYQPRNKSAAAIAIDMHASFAHRTYSTNRRLPNVRKIKCKNILVQKLYLQQLASTLVNKGMIGPIRLQPLNGRHVDYETGGRVVLFQHLTG